MKLFPLFKYHKFSLLILILVFLELVNITFISVYAQQNKSFVVVLDAGHGGKDPGKIGYKGAKEKDVALNIVLKTGEILSKIPRVEVMYTRKKDVFVNLWERGNIANNADADLFVSVHCNAHHSKRAIGSETWVLGVHANERNFSVAKAENEVILQEENHQQRYQGFNPKSPTSVIGLSLEQEEYLDQSLLLASLIQQEFEKKLHRVNRGVKQAGFVVLYQTYMPSVLIETGFLTNKIEGKYLFSKLGQAQMSKSIAKSILDYYKQQQLNVADGGSLPVLTKERFSLKKENSKETYYKIQIASSRKKISTASYNFKGFTNVESVKTGSYYKYYLGNYYSKNRALEALKKSKSKGYTTGFIVAFKNGEISSNPVFKKSATKKQENSSVFFKVQLASSTKKIRTKASNFKGLKNVEARKVGNYYKYYFGKTSDYTSAKQYLKRAKAKKYNSAFIVAFLNNKIITLKEALKIQTN